MQQLNKIAADRGLHGNFNALVAIAACVLLDQNNDVVLDGRDIAGTLSRLTADGPVPVCRKYSVAVEDIQALGAVAIGTVPLVALPANAVLIDFAMQVNQVMQTAEEVDGPLITAAAAILSDDVIGDWGDPIDGLVLNDKVENDVAGGDLAVLPKAVGNSIVGVAIELTGGNANDLVTGGLDVWLTYFVRP